LELENILAEVITINKTRELELNRYVIVIETNRDCE
jgi:hypothetical protein